MEVPRLEVLLQKTKLPGRMVVVDRTHRSLGKMSLGEPLWRVVHHGVRCHRDQWQLITGKTADVISRYQQQANRKILIFRLVGNMMYKIESTCER